MNSGITQQITAFFERYENAVNEGQAETIAQSYFETYIAADPQGVEAISNNDEYRQALEQRTPYLREQLGFQNATLTVEAVRDLAPLHVIADVRWNMYFEPSEQDPITSTFMISYIVRLVNDKSEIVMYVSHENEEAVMRRDGIFPAS